MITTTFEEATLALLDEGTEMLHDFERKARTNSILTRWWYRRAAAMVRYDVHRLQQMLRERAA